VAEISEGEVTMHPVPPRRAACSISADPVAFFLVAVGRRSQWGQIARGRLVAWGPRPWLGLRLTRLFPSPG
jgi:hypothetical protein